MVLGTDRRVLVLALARMADAVGNSFLIIVLPLYLASDIVSLQGLLGATVPGLGITITEELLIGVLLSLFGFLNSFAQPFTGRLSDRTGKRRVYILFGLVLLGAASAAYAFAQNYATLVVLRALQGLGAAFTIPVTIALVNELATTESRGGNLGVFNTFRLIGFGFGPIVAGLVVAAGPYTLSGFTVSGFDAAFYTAALGALVSIALVTVFVSDPETTEDLASEDLAFQVRDPTGKQALDPVFALGVATLFMGISIALFATLQENVNTRLGQGEFLFGVQFAAVIIANVLLQVPIGQASDRIGRRPFLLWGFVLLAPAVLAQGLVTDSLTMIAARLIHGVAVAMVFAPGLAVAGDLAKEGQSGTTLSVLTMAFGLGTAIGPLASGYLVRFGFVVPFAFAAVLSVLALALVYSQVEETLPA
ncbi:MULTISPECIES: MFS transporter [unclassified Haladaptatus]|uniref:MFS transporter n=1 Tax=unclassified Haladaptatus TaxID=2622732 RepID=UPI0023E882F8|nr:MULTISPECIES: MFS transporter [unclassified Haladaptatus]